MGWDRKTEQTSRRRVGRRRAGVIATLLVATLTVAFGSSMAVVANQAPEPDVTTDAASSTDQTPPPVDTTSPSDTESEPESESDTEPVPPVEELSTEDETAPPGDSAAPAAPVDDDGVPAWIEDGAPNGGDGNGDGILDSLQANVASLPSVYDVDGNGALDDYITIESPEGTTLAKVKALAVPAAPAPPDGATFPAGLVDYDVHVANPGDRADVKLYLPDGEHGAVYMFQGGEWSDFTHRAEIDNAANEVTLRLVDGGAGDENGTDGVIHDPVGVATPPAATTSFTVRTDNVPEPGVTFVYTLFACNNGSGTPSAIGSCTSVATSPALADGAEHTFTNITVSGNQWFRVQRAANTSWIVSSITCSGGTNQNTADIANRSGAVRLSSGAASGGQCSFLNAQAGTVSVIKQTVPDGSLATFSARLGRCGANTDSSCTNDLDNNPVSPSPQAVTDNNSATWTLTQNGRYVLDEGSNPGWTLSAPACTGATNQSANGSTGRIFFVTDRTATAVVCTFTNTELAPVDVTVKAVGDRTSGATNPVGATPVSGIEFQVYTNSNGTTIVPGATCVTIADGTCTITGLDPSTTYYVGPVDSTNSDFDAITVLNAEDSPDTTQPKRYLRVVQTGVSGVIDLTNNPFLVRRVQELPTQCGVKVALLFDLSTSVDAADLDLMKGAATGFVSNLGGTPTEITTWTFGTNAPSSGTGNGNHTTWTSLTVPGNVDVVNGWITAMTTQSNNFTNWDAALRQIVGSGAEILVVLTDGDPTAYGVDPVVTSSPLTTGYAQLENGIASANQVKLTTSIIGVGIGLGANSDVNLKAISGDESPFYFASNFGNLATTLKTIASGQCGGTLTVSKTIDDATSGGAGWKFGISTNPVVTTDPEAAQQTTGANGSVQWDFPGLAAATTVTVSEISGPPGFTFGSVVCKDGDTVVPDLDESSNTYTFLFEPGEQHIYSCIFDNETIPNGSIVIKKVAKGGNDGTFGFDGPDGGSAADFSLSPTTPTGNPNEFAAQSNPISVEPGTYVWSELGPPAGWVFTAPITCDDGLSATPSTVAGQSATIKVDPGETVTCTWTNTKQAKVKVVKKVVGGEGTFTFSLTQDDDPVNGQSPLNLAASPGNDGTGSWFWLAPGEEFAVAEGTLPEGWASDGAPDCSYANEGSADPDDFDLAAGDVVTCVFSNTNQSSVTVVKTTVGGTGKFTFTLKGPGEQGPSQTSSVNTKNANPNSAGWGQLVPGTYVLSENDPGQRWIQGEFSCNYAGSNAAPVVGATPEITLVGGQAWTCEITNHKKARIVVEKVTVTPNQNDETTFEFQGALSGSIGDGGKIAAYVDPADGPFVVTESAKDKWALVSIECDEGGAQSGARKATYTPDYGDKVTCVFTNGQARIRVQKETVTADLPDDTEFSFSGDIAASLGDGQSASELVAAGTDPTDYSVTEGDAPGWALTLIECDEGAEQSGAREATYSVSAGDDLLCTFTNTELGTITIVKDTGDPAVGVVFSYDATGGLDPATFDLDTDLSTGLGDSRQFSDVLPDTYSVTEDELAEVFGHWALALPVTCVSDLGDGGSTFTQIDAQDGVTNGGVSIEFLAGDDVICTFANSFVQATATVRVTKRVVGDAAPDAEGPFPVTLASAVVPFSQTQSIPKGTDTVTFIPTAGLGYSVTEDETALEPGWHLVGIECEVTLGEGDRQGATLDAADFSVLGGEIIDCTVTNDPVVDVGGIQVLPLTGSGLDMALKSALWALGLGGLLLLAAKWRRRHQAGVVA